MEEINYVSHYGIPGIYIIICEKDCKYYIGSASNLYRRTNDHKRNLIKNKHINKNLQEAWNNYGFDNFKFYILEYCRNKDLESRKQFYLDLYLAYKNSFGYNIVNKSHRKVDYEVRIKEKFSVRKINSKSNLSNKGNAEYWADPVNRQKMSEEKIEYFSDPANRQKTSEATSKAMNTPEIKQKIGNGVKKFNAENPERYNEIKAAQKATLSSDEHRLANSKRSKELWQDPNHRKKVLIARKNMYTDEVKAKMSKKAQTFWDDPIKAKELMIKRSNITKEQFEQLKELRKLGYNQVQIAKVLGCKKEAVGRICRGESKLYSLPKIEDGEIQLVDINVWENANNKLGIDMSEGQSLHLLIKF